MQTQPGFDEPRPGREQRARQAALVHDDAFKGGGDSPSPRLGLRRPWMLAASRLLDDPDSGGGEK